MEKEEAALAAGLKQKIVAWWNGYESPPLAMFGGLDNFNNLMQKFLLWWNGGEAAASQQPPDAAIAPPVKVIAAPRVRKLDISARGTVSQALWGEGNLNPGTPEFITDLSGRLGLTSEMSMLDLGAGLGGPARAISSAYGIWVTAFETALEHVKVGMELSVMHGMGKKVPITQFDPETAVLPKRKFDCIFSKDMLHLVHQKERLLMEIEAALKVGGQFFIIDFIITEQGKLSPRVAEWNSADEQASHFWSKEDYTAAFSKAKLDLRVTEDLTPRYSKMIAEGFQQLKKNMDALLAGEEDADRQSELRRALAFESNRWAVRAEAMQAGDIAVTRFSGLTGMQPQIR